MMEAGIRETMTVTRATSAGIDFPESVGKEELVSFTMYKQAEGTELFLGLFNNFRAITSYNFSTNYAMVVTELSEIFAKAKKN